MFSSARTAFFDLYGLRNDFPGVNASASHKDPYQRCRTIEEALTEAAVRESGCRRERFFAHVQPHEFEALLFSDVSHFATVEPGWHHSVADLQTVRDHALTPEHINDGPDTHPSAQLKNLTQPKYKKPLHGSRVAGAIGMERIRLECPHFRDWLQHIESLKPLA
jgi:hypothetical protein